ncbi:MAG: HNH endonuclease [Alphaproteobacteria bacterium]|nr:HNH endonuclease [Alphaproteobacteria bacterium]
MREIKKPDYDNQEVYQLCVQSISDDGLRDRLNSVSGEIHQAALDYDQKAHSQNLFQIQANHADNNSVVIGHVSKKELRDLYSQHMVGSKKPARDIYDKLMANAPLGICPFCGFGVVGGLDHYLPQAKFPLTTILSLNLVPSCGDCNKGKSAGYPSTAEGQSLHPYYDHSHFISDRWLYAAIHTEQPVTLRFFVETPESWDDLSKQRVRAHFNNFDLARRLPIAAGSRLQEVQSILRQNYMEADALSVSDFLGKEAKICEGIHKNSWQTAMFWALAESEWYRNGGYRS